MAFFEGCPLGWGGVITGAGLVDGGVDQGPWLQERVWGGRGDGSSKEGGGLLAVGGGARASVAGGVGGRGTGPRDGANFATCVVFLLFLTRTKRRKMAFFEGCPVGWGGTHWSWPGGRGCRPRALIPGEGVREGLAWGKGWVPIQGGGKGSGGG